MAKVIDFKEGEWFFDPDGGRLSVLKEKKSGYCVWSDAYFEISGNGEFHKAFPLTMRNKRIADEIRGWRNKFYKENLLNPDTGRKLEEFCIALMELDEETSKDEDYKKIYTELERYHKELKET